MVSCLYVVVDLFLLYNVCIDTILARDNERIQKVEDVIAEILHKLEEKETRISQLENIVHTQSQKITFLEEKVNNYEQVIQVLRDKLELFDGVSESVETEHYQDKDNDTDESILADKHDISTSKHAKQNHIRQAENESPVAFLATLTQHLTRTGAMQNIAFDKVITNVGVAYNPHGGVFIAPVAGIYVFSTTLLAHSSTDARFYFLKNGSQISGLYHDTSFGSTSMSVVLELTKGDDVSVANVDPNKELNGDSYTSFSGFLLQQYYPDTNFVGK